MSEQAVAAIREMLQPGTILQVTESQLPLVPVGRKQVVTSREPNGIMTEIQGDLPSGLDRRSFIPVGGGCGPADAEQLLGATFAVFLSSAPDSTRITYKVVDTIYLAITQGPDGLWDVLSEGEDFPSLADLVFDTVTAPGGAKTYLDWQILTKSHIEAHPDQYPMRQPSTDSAPSQN